MIHHDLFSWKRFTVCTQVLKEGGKEQVKDKHISNT